MYYLQRLKSLFLLLCIAVTVKAQLSDGKVYNFVNVGKGTSMSITSTLGVNVKTTNPSDYSQLWYAASEGNGFTLRNLGSGRYLKSPNATSNAWTMVRDGDGKNSDCVFSSHLVSGDSYAIRVTGNTNDWHSMHADGGGNIVCWESSNANSQWKLNVVDVDAETLNKNWETLASIDPSAGITASYQTALDNLFIDKACTTLKKSFANENAVKNDVDYQALPSTLQAMVLKVYKNSWAEDNYNGRPSWGADYAKKYRVQLYEPYNEPEAAAKVLRFNAHTNMNNPTGIFANQRTALYVMVEGDIKEGSSLYLASYVGHSQLGGYKEGVELKSGLNVVPVYLEGSNFCINYVIHNFDNSKGTGNNGIIKGRELDKYPDMKIHIEGGYINGYYNKVGDALYGSGDKNSDWEYIEERATQTDVTVLGKYMTLQFPLRDEDTEGNKGLGSYFNEQVNVEDVINSWDDVMMWERFMMGLLDQETLENNDKTSPYSDKPYVFEYTGNDTDGFGSDYSAYYNIHGLAIADNSTYMSGGWKSSNYHCNTMDGVIKNLPTNAGSHWGPAHEIGHQHQQPLNLNGLTEVTNNLFSNVVLWYFGETTSRYNGSDGALSNVLAAFNTEGSDFYTNNIWAQTHLYYKLFLYYHVLGHNPKFYPRLFEMLRQDPMINGGQIDGATSLLHFYKKCCLASGDDLTEFFRAYGFFRVMTDRLVGDYSNGIYNMTQAQIDAAIKDVKDLGYKENIAVLFINDATGETIQSHKGDKLEVYGETTICAEVGSYASFATNTTPDYTYSVSGTTVTMEGSGGTGFVIFNDKGEIVAFSDKKTFEISEECATVIASGKAEVKTVQADNTTVEAVDVMDTDDTDAKYVALGELLIAVADLLNYSDADNSKPGFYKASAMENLLQLYTDAQDVYNNKVVDSYAAIYPALYQEYISIITLGTDKTPFLPGSTYVLTNKKYPQKSMALNGTVLECSDTDMSATAQQWTFEETDETDVYYLKNVVGNENENYVGSLVQSTQVSVTTKDLASRYRLYDLGEGLWALQCQNNEKELQSLHCNEGHKVVGWTHTSANNDGSWWYLTATVKDESSLPLYDLEELVGKTQLLMNEVGEIVEAGCEKIALTADDYYCNAKCLKTSWDRFESYEVLCDGNTKTYLHTDYSGDDSEDGYDHYIRMDVGEGNKVLNFKINYTTRDHDYPAAPTSITVQGSNDLTNWDVIENVESGLPTTGATAHTLPVMSNGIEYRYIRFVVRKNSSNDKKGGHYYFVLSELGISEVTYAEKLSDTYSSMAEGLLLAAHEAALAARGVIATAATDKYEDAYTTLKNAYDDLLEAKKNVDDAALGVKKNQLQALINSTTSLINSCGSVTYIPEGNKVELKLQVTNPDGDNYLSTNAQETLGEHYLSNLLDYDNASNHFHSAWSWDVDEVHHLKVDLGNGKSLDEFTFTYRTAARPYPYEIKVYGSNDDQSYTHLKTFSKNDSENRLPTTTASDDAYKELWTSSTISSDVAYRYLRFDVTNSGGTYNNANPMGEYCFTMSYFGITAAKVAESYIVELGAQSGGVTKELLLTTYMKNAEAQATITNATTESQVEAAIKRLTAAKEALEIAQNASRDYTVAVVGGNNQGGVIYGGANRVGGVTFGAPVTLGVDDLEAIQLDGYEVKDITIVDNVITVTYNKVYTVNVVGGADGGVTYNETPHRNGERFDAPEGFTIKDLSIIAVDGYAAGEISLSGSVVTVTYKKIYSVKVVGVDGQGGVMFADNEYMNGEEIQVLGTLETSQLTALSVTGYRAHITLEGTAINVTYNKEYTVEVVGIDTDGGVIYNKTNYRNKDSFDVPQGFKVSDLMVIHVDGYVYTVTLEGSTVRVIYTKLIQDLSALRNYKVYHIRARSGEGYFAWNSSITDTYVSLRGVTNSSDQGLPADANIANKYTEAVDLSDKTVVWQIIKEGDSYYLYQPEKEEYVTRSVRDYVFTADKIALDGIRQNSGDHVGTFGIHAGGDYSDGSQNYACICTKETPFAVRNWTWSDHGSVLQIIENPYVYALDYEVKVVGNANGGVEFEGESYTHGMTLSATELLTGDDLTMLSFDGCESIVEVNPESATITVTYTALNKTELIDLITTTEALVNGCYENGAFKYTGSLNVTEALIGTINTTLTAAREVRDDLSVSLEGYKAALAELREAYERLNTAVAYANLPVQLTFDANSPVTYKIKIARANTPVLAYDESSAMVAVTTFELGNKSHGWYFMATTDGKVRIMPYHNLNTTLALSTNSFAQDNSKVKGMDFGTAGYTQEWTISNTNMNEANRNAGWYNITTINPSNTETTWYFSNHGGVSNKMGFYNDPNDSGTLFKFEQADFSKSEAYYALYNYYHNDVRLATGSIEGCAAVGYFSEDVAAPYNEAYNNATAVLANTTATDEDYISAHEALKKANEALVLNMPEEGKFYVLRSAFNGYSKEALVYADPENNKMYWNTSKSDSDATAIWTFTSTSEGNFTITNLHTGTSIGEFIGSNPSPLREVGGAVSIKPLSGDGQVGLISNGTMMHAQRDYSAIVHWETGAGGASAWRIVEVEDMSLVNFALKIGQYRHAGLYLNYAAEIPENVKVYIAHTPDGADGSIIAEELEGTILPARTAVIVKGDAATYNFKYTSEDYDGSDDLSVNLLGGSAYLKYQQVKAEGNRCCVFGQKSGVVGLYKNYVEYTDAMGAQIGSDKNSVADSDNGTHFKVSANKIYYEYKPSAVAGASAFRFRFNSKEEGTTTIDELLMLDETIIYNLYGQRLTEIVVPGVYIVNGKKMYVSEKMIGNNK